MSQTPVIGEKEEPLERGKKAFFFLYQGTWIAGSWRGGPESDHVIKWIVV
jgi:hypothetical protein